MSALERKGRASVATAAEQNVDEVKSLARQAIGHVAKLVGDGAVDRFLRAAVAHYLHADKPERMHRVHPRAYMASVMDAAVDRLLPDGRDGWIIPYGESCKWHPSWRGLVKLARRSTVIRDLSAEIVYQADDFQLDLGSNRRIEHRPFLGPLGQRGNIIGAYAGCKISPTWTYEFRFIDEARLQQVSTMSGNPKDSTPSDTWIMHPAAMRRKHAIRQLMDWIEAPDEVLDCLAREDERMNVRQMGDDVDAPQNGANREGPTFAKQIRDSAGEGEQQP